MEKTLNIIAVDGVFVMLTFLSIPNTPDASNVVTVIEPLLRVLIQVILARGRPSAEQLRDSGLGLRSWTVLEGEIMIPG